jgi:hypothetical protein
MKNENFILFTSFFCLFGLAPTKTASCPTGEYALLRLVHISSFSIQPSINERFVYPTSS